MEFPFKYLVWITILLIVEGQIIPKNYTLTIWTNLEKFMFSGTSKIFITTAVPTRTIQIHCGENLKINGYESNISNETHNMSITRYHFRAQNEMLTLKINIVLEVNATYLLVLAFSSNLEKTDNGFYRDFYENRKTGEKIWYAATQLEMNFARRAFPCFDDPFLKIPFSINIGHSNKFKALSNMPLIETVSRGYLDWMLSSFETSPPMSTYMVAFFVSDFTFVNCTGGKLKGKELRIWTRKNATDQTKFACPKIPEMIGYFQSFYKSEYPLPKLDIIAINEIRPSILGSWGLVFYEEFRILTEEPSLITSRHLMAHLSAQVSNQWFANLVVFHSSKDWWIVNSLGLFLGYNYVKWATESKYNLLSSIYFKEKIITPKTGSFFIESIAESKKKIINKNYDDTILTHGTYFFYMLNSLLEEKVFSESISIFLKNYRFQVVSQNDFWSSFNTSGTIWETQLGKISFSTIVESWMDHSIFSYIFIDRNYINSTIKVVQRDLKSNNYCIWIPLTFTTETVRNFSVSTPTYWNNCTKLNQELTVANLTNNTWIYSPRLKYSLYRINYDEENWKMICHDLWTNKINPIPKDIQVELIESVIYFGSMGQISSNTVDRFLKYVVRYDNGDILEAILPQLIQINNILMKNPKPKSSSLTRFIRIMIKQVADRIENRADGDEKERRIRNFVNNVSILYRVNDWTEAAQYLFREWMRNPDDKNPINVDIRESVYCVALERGRNSEIDFLLNQLKKSNVAEERMRIMNILKCAFKPKSLKHKT